MTQVLKTESANVVETLDNTPMDLLVLDFHVEANLEIVVQVFARADSGVCAFWFQRIAAKVANGVLAKLPGSDKLSSRQDVGAALWDVVADVTPTEEPGGQFHLTVTGSANERVIWGCAIEIVTMA